MVGEGSFTANVPASGRSPFPSSGKLYAFSGKVDGKPAILAHVYGVNPAPTSFTLAFIIGRAGGKFGTTLTVDLPKATNGGYITGISLDLFKNYTYKGKQRSYISATCPAPKDVKVAGFAFAKATFAFIGGKNVDLDPEPELHRARLSRANSRLCRGACSPASSRDGAGLPPALPASGECAVRGSSAVSRPRPSR